MPQTKLPELEMVRVTRSNAEVFRSRPSGDTNVKFELTFDVTDLDESAVLVAAARYDVDDEGQEGGRSSYYRSEVTQRFQFAGPLLDDKSAGLALAFVWPYIRQSVQSLAVFHGVPLRGVPLLLDEGSFAEESEQ